MPSILIRHFFIFMVSILFAYWAGPLYAQEQKIENVHLDQSVSKKTASGFEFDILKRVLWNMYHQDAQALTALKTEYLNRELTFQDKTMRFSLEKIGKAPIGRGYPLYIALHGGGQAPASVNDSQWEAMKVYYRDSIKQGIYVATRGITNNWNLHFETESYPLYEKLIESAILFDNVDPNRIYFLGFSAGGDGVYQVVPRMPDRFAAANMSAGHHNWITFDNLSNTPFLMQVGELDAAYKRNTVAAENYITMNNLNKTYQGGFIHDVFIHYSGSHNSWYDNDASRKNQAIIADPIAWLADPHQHREIKSINTNAIDWLDQYQRNPVPEKLVWDLSVDANKRVYQTGAAMVGKGGYEVKTLAKPHALFYWLDVSVAKNYPAHGKLVVQLDKSSNTINVLEALDVGKFRILLNPSLLNLNNPIKVIIYGKSLGSVKVKERHDIMVRTLLERSDKNNIYDAQITIAHQLATHSWVIENDDK